jgi:hypothetical protein
MIAIAGALLYIAAGWLGFVHGVTSAAEAVTMFVTFVLGGLLMGLGAGLALRK